jgi:cytochrome c2
VVPLDDEMTPLYVALPCIGFRDGAYPFAGHQAGGRMVRLNDRQLLVSVGDHHFDGTHGVPVSMSKALPPERTLTTDPGVALGKIMQVDLDTGHAEVFATGLRNPQGLLIDTTGRVWETEQGPQGGDELNLMVRGGNYGWPEVTLGLEYGSTPWPFNAVQGRHDGYRPPQFAWVPSNGAGNLVEADAREFPLWGGDLLVASLRDKTLFRLRLEGDRVLYSEPIWIGVRLRDVIQLADGRTALYADSDHAIYILRNGGELGSDPKAVNPDQPAQRTSQADTGVTETVTHTPGARIFEARCASCHDLHGRQEIGPHLNGVIGRRVGASEGYASAEALRDSVWNRRRLQRFVRDPQSRCQDCRMPAVVLPDSDMEQLLTFLETQ